MKISMIAAVGKNLELGKDNKLLWNLPNDLKFFKKITNGKIVIMGKNTFKSLPKILPNRTNVVLTFPNDLEKFPEEVIVLHSIDEVLKKYQDYNEEIFIIGGASIYKQFIDFADTLYLTEVDDNIDADVYFPKFNKDLYKKEIIGKNNDGDIYYNHVVYRRI